MLFPNLWVSAQGDIKNDEGEYERNFLFWCNKLSHLTEDHYTEAFSKLEERIATGAEMQQKVYPPSYAEFIGLARTRKMHQDFKRYELPMSREIRNAKGKVGTANLMKILAGATPMPEDEADIILNKAREDSLHELFPDGFNQQTETC